jgi:hypothetical protein
MLTTTKVVGAFPPADVTIECVKTCSIVSSSGQDDVGSLCPA